MLIKIYDAQTLNAVAMCSKAISMQWERNFYSIGKFEFECSGSDESVEYLKIGNFITFDDKTGIILYRHAESNTITVKGYDLKYFCRSRIIIPPFVYKDNPQPIDGYERQKGNAETVIKYYADRQMITTEDTNRKIPHLVCAADSQKGERIAWQAKFTHLDDELEKICKYAKMGYDITFDADNKQFVFDICIGTDRTVSQSENAPVIFCNEYRNISQIEYTEDWLTAKNLAYVGGNGEEEEQFIFAEPSEDYENDFMRIESYTSVSSDDVSEVEDGGAAYLEENKKSETVSGTANSKYKYKIDWNLGDYVTAKMKAFGSTMSVDEQIIGVNEVYERDSVIITPVFSKDNLLKKILKG